MKHNELNFGAGPAIIPSPVLEEFSELIQDYNKTGSSSNAFPSHSLSFGN
jgi:phosphoserine aminotransferase